MLIALALGGCARRQTLACPGDPLASRRVRGRMALLAELGEIGP
jgi:hypothetical protein